MENRPETIDAVLAQLDQIIEESIVENNYLGIFAYVYRRTTAQIKQEIDNLRFEDNERMERFDVSFANFYLDAYKNFKQNKPIARSWASSFEAKDQRLTVMQHLIMGMNAHINHDLGIAAARFAPREQITGLKEDFMLVNDILQGLTNEIQTKLAKVSPLLYLVDRIGKRRDEQVANFSIVKARQFAWNLAFNLANMESQEQEERIRQTDQFVAKLSDLVKNPKTRLSKGVLRIIKPFEDSNVQSIIEKLR